MKNRTIAFTATFLAFGLLAPLAQPVFPPPDGGYPGFNTAEGQKALFSLTTGVGNAAVGWHSLFSNTDGSFNTATGAGTLLFNVGDQSAFEGVNNTAVGAAALLFNTTGCCNDALGASALFNNTTGSGNTALGRNALSNNTTGFNNTAIGHVAGSDQTSGSNNVYIGAGLNGVAGENDACYIKSIFSRTSGGGTQVFINANSKLGTLTSSKRFKEKITPMDNTSEALFALKPVTFHYKKKIDPARTLQFGLVAEEVEKVNPDLVVRDEYGKPYSVRYDQVNAMLLNEFLKEHKKVDEQRATIAQLKSNAAKQQATISELKKDVGLLTAQFKEQAAQIQKVSAQIEMSNPKTQVVLNNP